MVNIVNADGRMNVRVKIAVVAQGYALDYAVAVVLPKLDTIHLVIAYRVINQGTVERERR